MNLPIIAIIIVIGVIILLKITKKAIGCLLWCVIAALFVYLIFKYIAV
ncbi:MAG: hypothetical protein HFI05_01910 [Lachnospiraceae bacterium]|jgi:hypothetical protein|nr:hypothetical protein [Lachnospiraceae bacterium]